MNIEKTNSNNIYRSLFFLLLFLIPFLSISQTRNLYVEGEDDLLGTIHSLNNANQTVGFEFVIGTARELSGDWRTINQNGDFRIQYGTDNFESNSGDNMFSILSDGNTGIGCTNPKAKLSICNGEMGFSNSFSEDASDKISLDGYAFDQPHMVGLGYETSTFINISGQISELSDLYYKAEGSHRWYNNANADLGNSANMVLTQDGNLGLGTHTPDTKLHILTGPDASLSNHGYMMMGRIDGPNLILDNNEIIARDAGQESILSLQRNGGGVGIGIAPGSVEAPLAVQGSGSQIHISNSSQTSNDWFIGASNPNWLTGGGKLIINTGGNSTSNMMSFDRNTDIVEVQRNGGDVMLCSQENGQVGIGISDNNNFPSSEYLLAVDGSIIAEEVRVELSGDWPDYVFADDYDLMPLSEVEKSIADNNHLPGIPSAKEVASDGIALGDMQKKMMEKIEELTLYVIQLNKKNERLTAKVNQLNK